MTVIIAIKHHIIVISEGSAHLKNDVRKYKYTTYNLKDSDYFFHLNCVFILFQ